jgi:hypothetical protein
MSSVLTIASAVSQLRFLLDAHHPSFPGTYEIHDLLATSARNYLEAGALPLIDAIERELTILENGEHFNGLRVIVAPHGMVSKVQEAARLAA